MAYIRRRGQAHQVCWREPDGRRRYRTCPTQRAAEALRREVEEAVSRGRRWEPRDLHAQVGLEEVFKEYLAEQVLTRETRTVECKAMHLQEFLRGWRLRHPRRDPTAADLTRKATVRHLQWLEEPTGRHGRARSRTTAIKHLQTLHHAWTWAYDNDEDWPDQFGKPKRLDLRMPRAARTLAPTWAEMDAVIHQANGWQKKLAIVLRFTGLRVSQAMHLKWSDFQQLDDPDQTLLVFRGELGKTRSERQGRIIPISRHLAQELGGWGVREGYLIPCPRKEGPRAREARGRDMRRAWERAVKEHGVRPTVFEQPHHTFRKRFKTGLRSLNASMDAVDVLLGHSRGIDDIYVHQDALDLRGTVNLTPALSGPNVIQIAAANSRT